MTTSAPPFCTALGRLGTWDRVNAGLIALGLLGLTAWLMPAWVHNPDLSHGMLTPLLFVILLAESRSGRGPCLPSGPAGYLLVGGVTGGALVLLILGGLYAAALGWSHALVQCLIAGAVAGFLAGAILTWARPSVRLIPLTWCSAVAVLLWPLCAPLPPGTYSRITLALQLGVTGAVMTALHGLGIAALQAGNVIELSRATVGVEEACSGIRSLISCMVAALFLSAALVKRPWARFALIAAAPPLALVMNFFRSLILTLLASDGVDIRGFWHDGTGYAILALTTIILAGLAWAWRGPAQPRTTRAAAEGVEDRVPGSATAGAAEEGLLRSSVLLTASLLAAATLSLFFVWNTRPAAGG